jgi:hypothetical protein
VGGFVVGSLVARFAASDSPLGINLGQRFMVAIRV